MKNSPTGLHLAPIDFNEYKSFHSLIYSDDSLKYDDPDRPIPSIEDSKQWWLTKVKNNEHFVLSIRLKNNDICGLVHAFDFDNDLHQCEVGITVFPKVNWTKGIGYCANKLLLQYLKTRLNITKVTAQTNIENKYAIKLYEKSGFKKKEIFDEGNITWVILTYTL